MLPLDDKKDQYTGLLRLLFDGRQVFHQTTLAAGSIPFMKRAFLGRLVKLADGFHCCQASFFSGSRFKGKAGFLDRSAGCPSKYAVSHPFLLILFVTFFL